MVLKACVEVEKDMQRECSCALLACPACPACLSACMVPLQRQVNLFDVVVVVYSP